jgi:hypothetical protein
MKLHDLCIDRNVNMPARKFNEDHVQGDRWQVYDNFREDDVLLRQHANGDRRRQITEKLELEGIGRPVHAMNNSRAEK